MRRRAIAFMLLLTLTFSMNMTASAQVPSVKAESDPEILESSYITDSTARDKAIQTLLRKRLTLVNSALGSSQSKYTQNTILQSTLDSQIAEIDKQLNSLGVQEVSANDLNSYIYSDVQPMIEKPENGLYKWFTWTDTIPYDGTDYEVQTLCAQPNGKDCALYCADDLDMHNSGGVKAGALAAFGVVALEAASQIPLIDIILSFYDISEEFYEEGLKSSTLVENVEASYTWNYSAQTIFRYVRRAGTTDRQNLTFIYNTATGEQTVVRVEAEFGNEVHTANNVRTIHEDNIMTEGADDINNAIRAYIHSYAPTNAYLKHINVYGLNESVATTFSIPAFIGPGQMIY